MNRVVTRPLAILRLEDIAVYVAARRVVRAVAEAVVTSRPVGYEELLGDLRFTSVVLSATIAASLKAGDGREELRRLSEAARVMAVLRRLAWQAFADEALDPIPFDRVMDAVELCRREVAAAARVASVGRTPLFVRPPAGRAVVGGADEDREITRPVRRPIAC